VLAAFERLGVATASTDAFVHELLESDELRKLIVDRWGPDVAPGGSLDRSRISAIVFESPDELRWLEAQLHPRVAARLAEWRAGLVPGTELAVVEVPLLFETGMDAHFDAVVAVVAADEVRRGRAAERGIDDLEGRSGRQLSQDEKARRATHVITNDATLAELESEVAGLVTSLVEKRGDT
jgi:dephospho-CoA kinase